MCYRVFGVLLLLHLLLFIDKASAKSPLDCDFSSDCCWATTRESDQWEVRNGDELDLNEFRRVFLAGKSRAPPTGNYAIRVENQRRSSLISCPVCAAHGSPVTVRFRHWQSANALLKICWQSEGDGSPAAENCQLAKHSKQSRLNAYTFDQVALDSNFRLVFIIENAEAEMPGGHEATIIVDRITVDYVDCEGALPKHETSHLVKSTKKKREKAYLKNVDDQIAKVVAQIDAKNATTPPPSPPSPKSPVDPLTDLLGSDFVNFLDPNYESEGEEEEEQEVVVTPITPSTTPTPLTTTTQKLNIKRVKTTSRKIDTNGQPLPNPNLQPVVAAAAHLPTRPTADNVLRFLPRGKPMPVQTQNGAFMLPSQQHHQIPLGIPSTCSTAGGCLFETDFCNWKTPNGIENKFHMKKVHLSSFAEAIVPTGERAVMEVETQMSQPHTILFDSLEFASGTRLIACCLAGGRLVCPFSTPPEASAIVWQFAKFECPTATTRIAFICENFGLADGICGVDNVRVHTSTDVFFLEPCQKDRLHRV